MIFLRRPSERRIHQFMQSQAHSELTYQEVGETHGPLPANYFHNECSIELGRGQACFEEACDHLRRRRCLQLDWVQLCSEGPPSMGQNMAIVAHVMGVWTMNCCRVIDLGNQPESSSLETNQDLLFSFALGTLPRHIMVGEERFSISMDGQTEMVHFSIRSFSRASNLAGIVGRPFIRHYQRRFVSDVANALRKELKR